MTDDSPSAGGIGRQVVAYWKSKAPLGVLFAWAIVAPLLILAYATINQADNPIDVCSGLGFGCVPDAFTTALLLSLVLVAPVLVGVLVLIAIAAAFKAKLSTRVWLAAIGPPVAWIVIAIVALT